MKPTHRKEKVNKNILPIGMDIQLFNELMRQTVENVVGKKRFGKFMTRTVYVDGVIRFEIRQLILPANRI